MTIISLPTAAARPRCPRMATPTVEFVGEELRLFAERAPGETDPIDALIVYLPGMPPQRIGPEGVRIRGAGVLSAIFAAMVDGIASVGTLPVTINVPITGQGPTVVSIPDVSLDQQAGATYSIGIQGYFTGSGLTFSLPDAPAGVSIDPVTGEITGSRATAGTTALRVRAENQWGSAEASFTVTVAAASATETLFDAPEKLADLTFARRVGDAPSWAYQHATGDHGRLGPLASAGNRVHGAWTYADGFGDYFTVFRIGRSAALGAWMNTFTFGIGIRQEGSDFFGLCLEVSTDGGGAKRLYMREYTGSGTARLERGSIAYDWPVDTWLVSEVEVDPDAVRWRVYPEGDTPPAWQIVYGVPVSISGDIGPGLGPNGANATTIDIRSISRTPPPAYVPPAPAPGDWSLAQVSLGDGVYGVYAITNGLPGIPDLRYRVGAGSAVTATRVDATTWWLTGLTGGDNATLSGISVGYRVTPSGEWSEWSAAKSITIEAEEEPPIDPPPPETPSALTAAQWTILEYVEAPGQPAGSYTAVIGIATGTPGAGAVEARWTTWDGDSQQNPEPLVYLSTSGGWDRWRMSSHGTGTWHVRQPGGSIANIGIRYRATEGGPLSFVSLDRKTMTVPSGLPGPEPDEPPASGAWPTTAVSPSQWPLPRSSALSAVAGRSHTVFSVSGSGGTGQNWGGGRPDAPAMWASIAYSGNTSCDAKLVAQINTWCANGATGGPLCEGGYRQQHENTWMATVHIVSRIPRIWNQISTANKTRIDIMMRASFAANCYIISDKHQWSGTRTIAGYDNVAPGWAYNYQIGFHGAAMYGLWWIGSAAAAKSFLDGFNTANFRNEMVNAGMAGGTPHNCYVSWTNRTYSGMQARATDAQINAALQNTTFRLGGSTGNTLANWSNWLDNRIVNATFNRPIRRGFGSGQNGFDVSGRTDNPRGVVITNPGGTPNQGQTGMANELWDWPPNDPPQRTSMSYAFPGAVQGTILVMTAIIIGVIPKGSARANNLFPMFDRGWTDLLYRSQNGYKTHSFVGSRGGDWTWSGMQSDQQFAWVFEYWRDIMRPHLVS